MPAYVFIKEILSLHMRLHIRNITPEEDVTVHAVDLDTLLRTRASVANELLDA
jgi:hypothetical protein